MYKKIKNGSFMNWIWFILCLLPLVFILIININNQNTSSKEIVNNLLIYNNDFTGNDDNEYYFENENINNSTLEYVIITTNYQTNNNNYALINNTLGVGDMYTFYIEQFNFIDKINMYIKIEGIENNNIQTYFYNTNASPDTTTLLLNQVYKFEIQGDIPSTDLCILTENISGLENVNFEYKLYIFLTYKDIDIELFNDIDDWSYIEIVKNELSIFIESIQTNGFISNAFLNLAQFFGVNNVYYSLACYYIEYLLIIVLLHLAFDVLYIVPNICHKFMEKIGGERD